MILTWIICINSKNGSTWFAETLPDTRLESYLGIMAEPLANDLKRYYIVTIVLPVHGI